MILIILFFKLSKFFFIEQSWFNFYSCKNKFYNMLFRIRLIKLDIIIFRFVHQKWSLFIFKFGTEMALIAIYNCKTISFRLLVVIL